MTVTKDTGRFFPRRTYTSWFTCRQKEDVLDALYSINKSDIEALKAQARPIGIINGAFDLLHPAHIRLIQEARWRSATLVALIDTDAKVRRRKGIGRPVLRWTERATAVYYLGADAIFEINNDDDFIDVVQAVEPDFRVLGGEYRNHHSRLPAIPSIYVRDSGFHTTDLIERIKKNLRNDHD